MRWVLALLASISLGAAPLPAAHPCPEPPHDRVLVQQLLDKVPPRPGDGLDLTEAARFCRDNKTAVLCAGGAGVKLTLAEVQAVDQQWRPQFQYESDFLHYGLGDYWSNTQLCGDCEDWALFISEKLHAAGEGGQYMGLVGWLPYAGVGHATLKVSTSDAGDVEVGVGRREAERPMDWKLGVRVAMMPMDGHQKWVLLRPDLAVIAQVNRPAPLG